MSETLTRSQIANEYLHCSEDTVANYRKEGLIGKRFGKEYIYLKEDVLEWIREQIEKERDRSTVKAGPRITIT